ncbi:MAG: tyrosine-type recombinase/integrase [Candidatus ainarchaeum sp.]|nr:tyrosine-type recombinase/integrase [Candidatus ainarchaeum sp.]
MEEEKNKPWYDAFYGRDSKKVIVTHLRGLEPEDRKLVEQYLDFKRAKDGISWIRSEKIAYSVATWRKRGFLAKPFREATKEDIIAAINRLEESDYAWNTKTDFKKLLKYFYTWLEGEDQMIAPKKVRWIRITKQRSKKEPYRPPTDEEMKRMLKAAASNEFPEAMLPIVAILGEMGGRIGEAANGRKLWDIIDTPQSVKFAITGKTNDRKPPLGWSLPYLRAYLNRHPRKDDPSAPLWIGKRGKTMKYQMIWRYFKKIVKKAGIERRVWHHLLRHYSWTAMTRAGMPSSINESYHGLVKGSKQSAVYDHTDEDDAEKYVHAIAGIKAMPRNEVNMEIQPCPRCGMQNGFSITECQRCGLVLNPKDLEDFEKKRLDAQKEAFKGLLDEILEEKGITGAKAGKNLKTRD